jgi:hypothetical protein
MKFLYAGPRILFSPSLAKSIYRNNVLQDFSSYSPHILRKSFSREFLLTYRVCERRPFSVPFLECIFSSCWTWLPLLMSSLTFRRRNFF